MSSRVLVLGATGTLGNPVAQSLAERGHTVRVLTRSTDRARRMFGDTVEIVEGDSTDRDQMRKAMSGCDRVHVSLPSDSELIAVQHITDLAASEGVNLVSYISGTSVREENRWFELIDVKLRAEETLGRSGIPHIVFCPTWVMEVLHKFVQGERAAVILGKNSPGLHFFAATDLGRMVAAAYDDERAISKRLYIHGPESITLTDALHRLLTTCYPQVKVAHLKLWQARLAARLTGRMDAVSRLIAYFDKVGELGDPGEANALLGAPTTTFGEWLDRQRSGHRGLCP